MNMQRISFTLTIANLILLAFFVVRFNASADGVVPVLRGKALEIVDDKGKVRASISVLPADPNVKMPDGSKGYPETVLMRMSTSQGRPTVKLAATENGAGLVLGGEANPTYIQVLSQGGDTQLKMVNKDGKTQTFKP